MMATCAVTGCQQPVIQRTRPGGRPPRYCATHPKGRTGRPAGRPKGSHHTAAAKAKISKGGTGRTKSAETRAKLSAANSGPRAPLSQVHKDHIAEAQRKTLAAHPVERERRGKQLQDDRERVLREKHGPNWQKWLTRRANSAPRTATPAMRAHLVIARAAKGTNSPELQRLLVEHRWHPLDKRTSMELLVLEYQAQADDARKFIRKLIKTQGHARPDDYSLREIDGYLVAGHTTAWIADTIDRSIRRVQQLVRALEKAKTATLS